MLTKIRSFFILKKIFTFVDNKVKFNLVVHNKKIQKILGLNIYDFRIFSGNYKKEKNNKTIEYNSVNRQIIFEGQYSNGKRNGEGKEYNEKGDLIFEGEYLNGKKWKGVSLEYDEDTGKLIFEYEYSKGIIDGIGKEYDKFNGNLLFSGNYFKGKRNGYGEEYKYFSWEKYNYGFYSNSSAF